MSTLQQTLPASDFSVEPTSFFNTIGGFFASVSRAHQAHMAYTSLSAMSDHELALQGMNRDDINDVVQKILSA